VPPRPPEDEARDTVERFRAFLASVWRRARERKRAELEARLAEVARQAAGLAARVKADPHSAIRDARRLGTEVDKVAARLDGRRRGAGGEDAGLLEGSG
jgi:hypothetical protein